MVTHGDAADYLGILPSKANESLKIGNVDQGDTVLNIAASFIRALDYNPPPFPQDPALHNAIVHTLENWNIGDAVNSGFMKCVDVGIAAAELFYPSHEFNLKIIIAICTAGMKWIDNVADDILEALAAFQGCFYARKSQLHPLLDCFASFMLRLYDHYEPYVADAMIMSCCTFIDGSCLEIRALNKRVAAKADAKLWPYYVRSLSGISGFYAYGCFPKKDHPDVVDYVQAIPEILIFTNFLNDVLSFYKEEMDGEQHNYCQTMSRVSGDLPIKVLQDVVDETIVVAKRAAVILKDAPGALKAFKEYEQGYMRVLFPLCRSITDNNFSRFHLDVAHYRLPAGWKVQFS